MSLLYLSDAQLFGVLSAAEQNGPREGALLKTTYYLALRAGEAANLRRDDFSAKRRTMTVTVLKRFKEKKDKDGKVIAARKPPPRVTCGLDAGMVERLQKHVTELDAAGCRTEWLFPPLTATKAAPTRWDVLTAYHRAARAAGLEEKLRRHPHVLRHTRAMQHLAAMSEAARAAGKTLHSLEMVKELQQVLRHASEDTCMSYIHATEAGAEFSAAATDRIGKMVAGIGTR